MKKIDREIKACQDLLAHYQGKKVVAGCPICLIENSAACACRGCSWLKFEKMTCHDFRRGLKLIEPTSFYRANIRRSKRWTRSRIRMLPRWIRLLKKERKSQ